MSWNLEQATEACDALLQEAVREELVADVPVGVFLSGGVDSTLVAAYASEASPRIASFCIDFNNWVRSEADDARLVAERLHTDHHSHALHPTEVTKLGIDDAFWSVWDEPIADQSIIPSWYLARYARQNVTVCLAGDGGDELFAGYSWYGQMRQQTPRLWRWRMEGYLRKVGLGRDWPQGCANADEYFRFLRMPSFSRSEIGRLFPAWTDDLTWDSLDSSDPFAASKYSDLKQWQMADLTTHMIDNNLARVDRASMAFGLEVRVPLLDHRLAEFAFSLPDDLCISGLTSKAILRRILAKKMPPSIVNKPKQGFSFPLNHFLTDASMEAAVRNGCLVKHGVMDKQALDAVPAVPGSGNRQLKLWHLYVFEKWAARWLYQN